LSHATQNSEYTGLFSEYIWLFLEYIWLFSEYIWQSRHTEPDGRGSHGKKLLIALFEIRHNFDHNIIVYISKTFKSNTAAVSCFW